MITIDEGSYCGQGGTFKVGYWQTLEAQYDSMASGNIRPLAIQLSGKVILMASFIYQLYGVLVLALPSSAFPLFKCLILQSALSWIVLLLL